MTSTSISSLCSTLCQGQVSGFNIGKAMDLPSLHSNEPCMQVSHVTCGPTFLTHRTLANAILKIVQETIYPMGLRNPYG